MEIKEVECKVYGKVQGVFYREFIKRKADELGIVGEVENLPDGSVKIVAQAPEGSLRRLVEHASAGPESAEVESLDVLWKKEEYGSFSNFSVK